MFFTHLGRVLAILVLVLGIFNITLAMLIAAEVIGPYEAGLARYFPGKSSGQVIDHGMYMVLFSVALGILTEIRYALRALSKTME
jgi:hypothetical protein